SHAGHRPLGLDHRPPTTGLRHGAAGDDTPLMTEIETPGGPMPIVEVAPDGDVRGAVVVVQEAFGLTPHIEAVAGRLAREGYHAVAPALFHRQGSPVISYEDIAAVMPVIGQLTEAG